MAFTPDKYQQAVCDFITDGEGSAIVEAVAGSGKTTTIVAAAKLIDRDAKCVFLAFNKSIAEELKSQTAWEPSSRSKRPTRSTAMTAASRRSRPGTPPARELPVLKFLSELSIRQGEG